jgi:hypothetical protein
MNEMGEIEIKNFYFEIEAKKLLQEFEIQKFYLELDKVYKFIRKSELISEINRYILFRKLRHRWILKFENFFRYHIGI